MKINRIWAMPNKETFKIKPIAKLLKKYIGYGKGWIDPFAGNNSPAQFTNDLNKNLNTKKHQHAKNYVQDFRGDIKGILFDPPYSLRQIKECYNGIGKELKYKETLDASFSKVKNILKEKIILGGIVISFGWSSNGFGKNRGFEIIEILLVPHGGHHNDTICVVERKIK